MTGADQDRDTGVQVSAFGPAARLTMTAVRLDAALVAALRAALDTAASDGAPAVLLDAEGEVFSLGMDIRAMLAMTGDTRPVHEAFAELLEAIAAYPGLSVALVDGPALGGGLALAAACDVVVATEQARFGLPEALWGLLPANAAAVIARRTGLAAARRLALETESVVPAEALRLGLADALAPGRTAAEGLVRRRVLRAQRVGRQALVDVKDLFKTLETFPGDYARRAIDGLGERLDDPDLRVRLAHALDSEGELHGGG